MPYLYKNASRKSSVTERGVPGFFLRLKSNAFVVHGKKASSFALFGVKILEK